MRPVSQTPTEATDYAVLSTAYSALLTGEEVAREIVEPRYRSARVARWLRVKRRHDRFAALLRRRSARAVTLPLLARLAAWPAARRPMAEWFLAG